MNFDLSLFEENTAKMNITMSPDRIDLLDSFAALLTERNKTVNLTAVTDARGIAVKHFADSLSPMSVCDFSGSPKVLDLGTGAGFPGMPLLIANPDIKITFMDSIGKKLDFIESALNTLSLEGEILNCRAEDAGRDETYRERFDIAVSRAVAPLNALCEYALPFVKNGGVFIAMKGAQAADELESAQNAIKALGGEVILQKGITLTDGERNLIVIKKVSPTPREYPRTPAKIKKSPL
ncbi:MAG: 16S rRNA (guanine(527)-N(7))-methyltransferase RsmG [Clostridia bacterium]|nr:16S rRNA (guanine(527)-N(7))-methyltransferase RsmG [Clostridia bacterium]